MSQFDQVLARHLAKTAPLNQSPMSGLHEAFAAHSARVEQKAAEKQAELDRYSQTIVGKMGFRPESTAGQVYNAIDSFFAAGSRGLGQGAAVPFDVATQANVSGIDDDLREAYYRLTPHREDYDRMQELYRYRENSERGLPPRSQDELTRLEESMGSWGVTPDQLARLNNRRTERVVVSDTLAPDDVSALPPHLQAQLATEEREMDGTNLEYLDRAAMTARVADGIRYVTDATDYIDNRNKDGFQEDVYSGSEEPLANMSRAWYNPDDEALMDRLATGAAAISDLFVNAVDAGIDNPAGFLQTVADELSESLGGMVAAGGVGLAMTNAGYSFEAYQKGIAKHQEENNGQLPDEETRQEMAEAAAAAFILNMGADSHLANTIGNVTRAMPRPDGLAGAAAQAITAPAKLAGNSALQGGTEIGATYFEGQAELNPASAQDLYYSAVVGAGMGATVGAPEVAREELSAAATMLREVASKVGIGQNRETAQAEVQTFAEAMASGDTSAYMDQTSEQYSPSRAMGVLFGNTFQADTTDEQKRANRTQSNDILTQATQRRDEAKLDWDTVNPEAQERQQANIAQLQTQLETAPAEEKAQIEADLALYQSMLDDANRLSRKEVRARKRAFESAQEELDRALSIKSNLDKEVPYTPEEVESILASVSAEDEGTRQQATALVINLAMEQPDVFTAEQLESVMTNPSLTPVQQEYLRTLSASKQVENQLKNMGEVTQDILVGSTYYKGLPEYRASIAKAVRYGSTRGAEAELAQLQAFGTSHAQKATLAKQANAMALANGETFQLVRKTDGNWEITQGVEDVRKNGGLEFTGKASNNLVNAINTESIAITTAIQEANALMAMTAPAATVETTPTVAPTPQATTAPVVEETPVPAVEVPAVEPVNESPVEVAPEPTVEPVVNIPTPEVSNAQATPELPASDVEADSTTEAEPVEPVTSATETVEAVRQSTDARLPKMRELQQQLTEAISKFAEGTPEMTQDQEAALEKSIEGYQAELQEIVNDFAQSHPIAAVREAATELLEDGDSEPSEYKDLIALIDDVDTAVADMFGDEATPVSQNEDTQESGELSNVRERNIAVMQEDGTTVSQPKSNPISRYFKQTGAKGEGAARKPLVAKKDFLSASRKDAKVLMEFLKEAPTDQQKVTLNSLVRHVRKWTPVLGNSVPKPGNPDFMYKDVLQGLANEDGTYDENVITAMAVSAFRWIAESSTTAQENNDEAINTLLGRPRSTDVDWEEKEVFGSIGTRRARLINSLGRPAVQMMGLVALDENTPNDQISRLESAVGAHIYGLLKKEGLLIERTLSSDTMKRYMNKDQGSDVEATVQDKNANAEHVFVRMRGTLNGEEMNPLVQQIQDAVRNSEGILEKLFGIDSEGTQPSFEPVPFKQESAQKSTTNVPSVQAEALDKHNKKPNVIRTDGMSKAMEKLPEAALLAIAGHVDKTQTYVHPNNEASVDAKNDGLKRELKQYYDFVELAKSKEQGIKQPFFLQHAVWVQQRVGMLSRGINMQASKIHRYLVQMTGWEQKDVSIDPADPAFIQFQLAVADSIGVGTDKLESAEKAIAEMERKLGSELMKEALITLRKILNDMPIQDREIERLVDAIQQEGGENFHSLDGLMGYATYLDAADTPGVTTFTHSLTREIDGKTNGPMLTQLLTGAASSVRALQAMVEKGGFFSSASVFTQVNKWASTAGNNDLYQSVAKAINDSVVGRVETNPKKYNALFALSSPFVDGEGAVTPDGRKATKTPVTQVNFGSSINNTVKSMGSEFADNILKRIEKIVNKHQEKGTDPTKDLQEITDHIKTLTGLNLPPKKLVGKLHVNVGKALQSQYVLLMGDSIKAGIESHYKEFLRTRDQINGAGKLAFKLYDTVRKIEHAKLVATITERDKNGNPKHDLSRAQEKELAARLAHMEPVVHTALSKLSNDIKAGFSLIKRKQALSNKREYLTEAKFGEGGWEFQDARSGAVRNMTSTKVSGMATELMDRGVGALVLLVHAFDSAISTLSYADQAALNVHDANIVAAINTLAQAKRLNENTFKLLMGYSIPTEMANTLANTLEGFVLEIEKDPHNPELKQAYKVMTKDARMLMEDGDYIIARSLRLDPVGYQLYSMKALAKKADITKLKAMRDWTAVDQYSMEGGNYIPTVDDKAEIERLLTEREMDDPESGLDSVRHLATLMKSKPSQPQATDKADATSFGEVGKVRGAADPELTAFLAQRKTLPAKLLMTYLKKSINNMTPFQDTLLKELNKRVDNVTVVYVTPGMAVPEGTKERAAGWFHQDKNGKKTIYVRSPDFTASRIDPELMLHELVHAATANTMAEARNNPDAHPEVIEILEDLEQLRGTVEKHLIGNVERFRQYSPALVNVEELVAWGMTNEGFQQVLKEVQVETREKNTLVEGMKSFIKSLVRLVFPADTSQKEVMESGLTRLISDAAAIMGAEVRPAQEINLAQETVDPLDEVMKWETYEVFDALARPTDTTSSTHQAHLRNLMDSMVTRLHGPFGAFKVEAVKRQALTPDEVFIKAIQENRAPFASDTLAAGFNLSQQESFVLESVEASVAASLNSSNTSYKELAKVYQQARKALRNHPALTADQYDFLFTMTNGADGKSAHLSRFAALALAYEPLNQAMKQMVPEEAGTPENASLAVRIQSWFNQVLTFLNERLTGTYSGQPAGDKIQVLADNLVHIEAKRRMRLANQRSNPFEFIEQGLRKAADKGRDGLDKLGNSKLFKESKSGYVRAAGKGLSMVAKDRIGEVIENAQILRDRHFKKRQGMVSAIISEMTGADDKTKTLFMLNRMTKNIERTRIEAATQTGAQVLGSFAHKGTKLTKKEKNVLTKALLHTDLSALMDVYSMDQLHDMLLDKTFLNRERAKLENAVNALPMGKLYTRQADDLGRFMVDGKSRNPILHLNAHNIAHLYGLPEAEQVEVGPETVALIDQLVTLNALSYSDTSEIQALVATEKVRGAESGIEFTLRLAKHQKEQSLEKLFNGSPVLMTKGYTKEITDPYKTVVAAPASQEEAMKMKSYSASPTLLQDPAAGNDAMKLYVIDDGGLKHYLSGSMSLTSERAKGTTLHGGLVPQGSSELNQSRMAMTVTLTRRKQALYLSGKSEGTHMVPVFNESGQIVNYRYMMTTKTRDDVLGRNNALDAVMGGLEGELMDKVASPEHNRKVVEALRDLYKADYHNRPDSYLTISARSSDPRLREIYRMLPYETKAAMKEVWGRDEMLVRADVLDLVFGYRKYSAADALDKAREDRNVIEKTLVVVAEGLFKGDAAIKVRKYEDLLQTVVKHVKDIVVVKNVTTLLGNVASNTTQLLWHGVNPVALVKDHKVATESAIAYRRDKRELDELEKRQAMGYTSLGEIDIAQRIPELKDALARNPSTPLIESGLMPTIVEDIDLVQDPYSYQSKTAERFDEWINKVPKGVRAVGKQVYMTHDTTAYKVLSQGTQLSDYVARYTLYQHVRNRDVDPMSHEEALHFVMEAFVNYDVPTHRNLQYMNDMGFVYFTKYYLRIQRVILALYRDQPARALAMIAFNGFFEGAQTVMDSQAIEKLGNPLAESALRYPSVVDQLATVRLATEIMK